MPKRDIPPPSVPDGLQILRIKDVALMFGMTERSVRRWEKQGKLPPRKQMSIHTKFWFQQQLLDHMTEMPVNTKLGSKDGDDGSFDDEGEDGEDF